MNTFERELTENILPFWREKMQDHEHGGFYGRIDGNDTLHATANKGAILNARILWTFSSAYRLLKKPEYLCMAQRAFDYLSCRFLDKQYGGVYWELDSLGIGAVWQMAKLIVRTIKPGVGNVPIIMGGCVWR